MNSFKILVIEDDPQGLMSVVKILEHAGHEVIATVHGGQALDRIRKERFDVVLSDIRMPEMNGLDFIKALRLMGDETPIVLMTAFGKVEEAVWAMKQGVVDFLTKPFKRNELLDSISKAAKRSAKGAASDLGNRPWRSAMMKELELKIQTVAKTSASVLLVGESGVGKERVAKQIHQFSNRCRLGQWVAINCAAMPESLIEAELFGFEKGSFTGANQAKIGLFELADQGTLLLDEIGDMPLSLQAKLLRVLQEGEVRRIGATQSKKIDVRIIAATHRNLQEEVKKGTFRQDLLFRLEVIQLQIPALRNRTDDLEVLVPELVAHFSNKHQKPVVGISFQVMEKLKSYSWPGNIRELSNVLERAIIFATDHEIQLSDLPAHIHSDSIQKSISATVEVKVGMPLKDVEELLIRKTLEATQGDKNLTAKLLGINSRTIYRKLEIK